ncbi:GntR family transcriptional regulator [Streptomyces resistomycificus]|uniref:GntR family transcriptional regulator n=1 Tax=Streptomyces resistomycificus TaxID=67356 RepID=A0A0L8KTR6_9ACTN|nr:GntR family transcriptional regulator [Streptomyces resistomycificus]KOG29346.1 GntR family transcriptional regulator [Streptomyces resistomycificus]KUO01680.1 GntR family transcriptional regulator [Streptomyces resistomycificus]
MSLDQPVSRRLLSDEVFHRLRDSIVRGELVPGEKVKDGELAERLGLSRTPVREALARLADIGLVEAKPGVYTRITTLNRRDVEKTLAVLRSLDQLAIETAVPVMTEQDLERMREANRDFEQAVAANDTTAALSADDRFHAVPIAASDNPVLSRIVEQLHPQIHRILYRKFSTLLGGRNTIDHHDELIAVCAGGDARAAAELSGHHWSELGGHINELFDTNQFAEATTAQ